MAGVGGSSRVLRAGGPALVVGMVLFSLTIGLLVGRVLGTVGGVTAQQSGGSGSEGGSAGSSGSGSGSESGGSGSGTQGTGTDTSPDPGGGTAGPGTTAGGGTASTGGTGSTAPTTAPSPSTTDPAAPTTTLRPPPDGATSEETTCPDDVPASPGGGQVRCYELTGDEDAPSVVVVPGVPVPLPIPAPVLVPVGGDTGDSNSTYVDRRTTVFVDVDNQVVLDGTTRTDTLAQRIAATIALLLLVPVVVALIAATIALRRRDRGAQP